MIDLYKEEEVIPNTFSVSMETTSKEELLAEKIRDILYLNSENQIKMRKPEVANILSCYDDLRLDILK